LAAKAKQTKSGSEDFEGAVAMKKTVTQEKFAAHRE
jgi:hypothetical protein